jgi:hypothetical protein
MSGGWVSASVFVLHQPLKKGANACFRMLRDEETNKKHATKAKLNDLTSNLTPQLTPPYARPCLRRF